MRRRRLLFALSADFGEYVTARIFSRGQPFDCSFALPASLLRYAPPGSAENVGYGGLDELVEIAANMRPDVVVLASGYLYPVNRIAQPERMRSLVERLRATGAAVATTDPWLRITSLKRGSRFTIYSVREGGVDAALSAKMDGLQSFLEEVFCDVPHVFAVPLDGAGDQCLSFFNPIFAKHNPDAFGDRNKDSGRDAWLFVLSKEDFVFLSGFEKDAFLQGLGDRIEQLLAVERNHLRFIVPEGIVDYLRQQWPSEARVEFIPFCDFDTFERIICESKVVAYWNVLSSSLLYCLYYGVPPIFFGKGHQAKVCEGLFEHVVEHVYRGEAPRLLNLGEPLLPEANALIQRLDLPRWLDSIRKQYAQSQTPAKVIERVLLRHGKE